MSEFIFVRHGQSEANEKRMVAPNDSPLTKLGREQAREMAAKLKKLKITCIVCSPLLRAQQTAEVIAAELGIDVAHIKVLDELRERGFSKLEGKPKTFSSEWYSDVDDNQNEYGAESRQDLLKRSKAALNKIKSLTKAGESVLAVGHVVSGFYLLQVASGKGKINDFDSYSHIQNADFIEVKI